MPDFQRITIENIEYFIVDSIQNLRAEDSFIHRNNKLSVFGGNGEARKYVGSYIDDSGRKLSTFFEYENWGITETKNGRRVEYPFIQKNCFFNKKNLQRYLVDAKVEYHKQEQKYHHDISRFYDDYVLSINNLPTENISFQSMMYQTIWKILKVTVGVISVRRMIYGQFGVRLYCPKLVIYQFLNYCLSKI